MAFQPLHSVGRSSAVRRFIVQVAIVLGLFTTAVVIGIYWRTDRLVMDGARQEADSFLDLVVTMRAWNAIHDGVYVRKSPTSPTNEYLRQLGIEPDTSTVSGTVLTLRNPAAMTREVSDLTLAGGGVNFRLTSLDPVNPGNAPDEWEKAALSGFAAGEGSHEAIVDGPRGRVYRRIRPLLARDECLHCHAAQGYKAGDIRGALSVSVPLAARDAQLRANAVGLAVLWAVLITGLGAAMYVLVYRMAARIEQSEQRLEYLATTDELTGLPNRRAAIDRLRSELSRALRTKASLGVAIVDIDHFKRVNDLHGHDAGDRVLVSVAGILQDGLREYDLVGRIGGEEFIVVAPQVEPTELTALAERLRESVMEHEIATGDATLRITVSVGCAMAPEGDETPERALKAADEALYAAKDAGRNRVAFAD